MRLSLLKRLLAVPSYTFHEDQMAHFIVDHVNQRGLARCGRASVDEHKNVFIVKGDARLLPCAAAHIDTVHQWREARIIRQDGVIFAVDKQGHRVGPGADDKTGVFVALSLLERLESLAVCLFAAEEAGAVGARQACADFFHRVGYVIEFDCPGAGLVSYTSGGERLFRNDGDFLKTAWPVLEKHRATNLQRHPFSDVMALRQRFPFECLNLSAGYRRWHCDDEYVNLAEVAAALNLGEELIRALGEQRYEFRIGEPESPEPPIKVTGLSVDEPISALAVHKSC